MNAVDTNVYLYAFDTDEAEKQAKALELFDRDYRARLTAFLQNQLRTLWVDEPQVDADDLEQSDSTVSSAPARGKKTDPS